MPFKSEAQRRWMYANHPEMAERWSKETPEGEPLPEHVGDKMHRTVKVSYELGVDAALDCFGLNENFGIKTALLPLAGLAAPLMGVGARMLGSAAVRGLAANAAPMAMNALRTNGVNAAVQGGMNMMQAGPGIGNKLKAGLIGGATGLVGGPGLKGGAAAVGAQLALPSINNMAGVH